MSKRLAMVLTLLVALTAPTDAQVPFLTGPSIHAFGFGDANFVATSRDDQNGFVLGQLVGHMSAALTPRLALFGEASLSGRTSGYALEVERVILRYDFGDMLRLSVGRYHTPISYWNTAFHHGLWLQTSVARPQMIRFGSQFIPVHYVGMLAEGALPTGSLGLGYTFGLGNGRQSDNIARAGDVGDSNASPARIAGLMIRPPQLLGLQIGGNVYTDRVNLTGGVPVDERIVSGHVVLARESPEILMEFARARHTADTTGITNNDAYYVQLGYRLPGSARAFKPYVRWERVDVAANDPLLTSDAVGYSGTIAGVRFDFADFAALKAEFRNDRIGTGERFNSVWLQASFAVTGGADVASMYVPSALPRGLR